MTTDIISFSLERMKRELSAQEKTVAQIQFLLKEETHKLKGIKDKIKRTEGMIKTSD